MNITVIGAGYVGLVQAVGLAEGGHTVTCVDINEERIAALKEARVPFFEPGIQEVIERTQADQKLTFKTDLNEALNSPQDVIFVCVQTPAREDGSCDLSAVESVMKQIAASNTQALVVMKSTTPPSVVRVCKEWLKEKHYASNPEFLREGVALQDFRAPERIIIGVSLKQDEETLRNVYAFLNAPIIAMSPESAHLAKYAANTMLAMRLSLMNELALIADAVEADIQEIEKGIASDHRIGAHFLRAGAGFGGSCFPKDVLALAHVAKENNIESLLISPIIEVNHRQTDLFVKNIIASLGGVEGKTLAVWGLAFNKNTDDVRESSAVKIVQKLIKHGARIRAWDPEAMENAKKEIESDRIRWCDSKEETLEGVEALCVLTEWDECKAADWSAVEKHITSKKIFDGKNILPRTEIEKAGLKLYGMGIWQE